jgi:hypothetical protein
MTQHAFPTTDAEAEAMRKRLAQIAFPSTPEEKTEAETLARRLTKWNELHEPIVIEMQVSLLDGAR